MGQSLDIKKTQKFMDEDFLLENQFSRELYHDYAKDLPIIDYHNHLPPQEIAENHRFENITQIWLYGDHYKWRAMRANGINEDFITGSASDFEKFEKWAATVPYTMRNPLYHWSHLELERYFDLDVSLNEANAKEVYQHCNEHLQAPEKRVLGLLDQMKVEVLCTTDDPCDNLAFHQQIQKSGIRLQVYPAFRPDKAILISQTGFLDYIDRLGKVADIEIKDLERLLAALHQRMDYFAQYGCCISDHGLEQISATDFTEVQVDIILKKRLKGEQISAVEADIYQSAILYYLGQAYHEKGWVQQLHLGALRNNNDRLLEQLGPDTGFDSMGDFSQAKTLSKFLNHLDQSNQLAKTILYNLNPRDNEVFITMAGNFNDGTVVGKMQYGSAWWFLDQLDGMEKQIDALSNMGLLSRFIGMLTDSRSFLSFPRHEYFRRLLCNILGKDIAKGYLPTDMKWIGKMVQDICYHNAKDYFNFK